MARPPVVRLGSRSPLRELLEPATRKDPRRQIAGALARKSGTSLEDALGAVNLWYDRTDHAVIEKVHPPVAGWGRSLRVGASTVDYRGTARHRDGRLVPVAFDAKMVTGKAQFGLAHVPRKEARRLMAQAAYLRRVREHHGYRTGFLLYCAEMETLWLLSDVDAVLRGHSIPVRTRPRPTKTTPAPAPVHHLPHLACPLPLAASIDPATRRPRLDYLRLVGL